MIQLTEEGMTAAPKTTEVAFEGVCLVSIQDAVTAEALLDLGLGDGVAGRQRCRV